jgi:hypothetical protein
LPVENPFTAEVRFHRRVHKRTPKELRLPVYLLKWWTGRSLESRLIQPLKAPSSRKTPQGLALAWCITVGIGRPFATRGVVTDVMRSRDHCSAVEGID